MSPCLDAADTMDALNSGKLKTIFKDAGVSAAF
jgi:hypothetical protein